MKVCLLIWFWSMGSVGVGMADEIVPITPCRILDTRNTTGPVSAGTTFSFKVRGTPGGTQGGDSGCGVPTRATAVEASLTAVSPSATGHVLLWAFGSSTPTTAALTVTATQTSNDGQYSLLGVGTNDLSLKPISLSADFVVDITGYSEPSWATLAGQATGTQFGHLLIVETAAGDTVKVYVPDSLSNFKTSWSSVIDDAVDNCVTVAGFWTDGSGLGEQGLFEARALPTVMAGYCGPDD